jgi:hypothetical protein
MSLRIPLFRLSSVALIAVFGGCATVTVPEKPRAGPFSTPANYSADASLGGIRRVVVLPIWVGEGTSVETVAALDPVFLTALQQEKRFEVVTLSRTECRRRYGAEALSAATTLPHDLFETLKRDFAADAVLFVDLTAYHPYKPITMGLRGKLASLGDARLIWTFDNVYAAEAPPTATRTRSFLLERDRTVPGDLAGSSLQSPAKFAALAAASMFATLPPVTAEAAKIAK